jgi:hypothetical protein
MKLYKFLGEKTFEDNIESYLRNEVWVSAWNSFNDPMEGFFRYVLTDRYSADMIVGQKSRYRVSCFTRDFDNYLMWSHYANKHHGVCLEYEVDHLQLGPEYRLQPVSYCKSISKVNRDMPFEEQAVTFLFSKSFHWKYEKEERLLFEGDHDRAVPFGNLTAITFGVKFNAPAISNIALSIIHTPDRPKLYQAKINYDKISIVRDRLSYEQLCQAPRPSAGRGPQV